MILFECTAVFVRREKFLIENITHVKKWNVAGKLPLLLNRSSPKTTRLESSTIQARMQKSIWDVYKRQVDSTAETSGFAEKLGHGQTAREGILRTNYFFVADNVVQI